MELFTLSLKKKKYKKIEMSLGGICCNIIHSIFAFFPLVLKFVSKNDYEPLPARSKE